MSRLAPYRTFPSLPSKAPRPHSAYPILLHNVTTLAKVYKINQGLLNLLGEISAYITSQTANIETPSLHYRLLSFYSETQQVSIDISPLNGRFHSHSPLERQQIIEESLLIGALLYISLPHLRTVLPSVRPINYEYLLSRLDVCKGLLFDFDYNTVPQHAILLLWLSFLGEIFSSSPCAARYRFNARLRALTAEMSISTWEDMTSALDALWWIEPVYDEFYRPT